MRLLFYRPAQTLYTSSVSTAFQQGVPLSSGTTIGNHVDGYKLTGNKGNMIHRMAMLQLLDFDRPNSAQMDLAALRKSGKSIDYIKGFVREHFDAVVLTFSNIIRKGDSDGFLTDIIKAIDIPIVTVGVGLQDTLSDGIQALDPATVALLQVLNDRSVLFGVRGHRTQEWCHEAGFKKAKAIGCPSMFAYPQNIRSLKPAHYRRSMRVMTAGHLHPRLLDAQKARIMTLMVKLPKKHVSYVFQSELSAYTNILGIEGLYNEASSEIDAGFMNSYLQNHFGINRSFDHYYCFNDAGSWRQAASFHDLYVGDRIHGGVAAMQAGTPAIVLYEDIRVAELTAFHGIPNAKVSDLKKYGFANLVDMHLNSDAIAKFKKRYGITLGNFCQQIGAAGLELAISPDAVAQADR
ncbi:polysaccharide pyruvyl transferase family protein [Alcaligenaceae bacterium]|nr:polysaccharide pyruvyl transferase family protein [Alcaligenaceae bacterium]